MKHGSPVVLLLAVLGLAGCNNPESDVQGKIEEIRKQPTPPIPLPPQYVEVPTFSYSAQQLRNPFVASSVAAELKVLEGRQVLPDFNRPKETLEGHAFDSLQLRGSMTTGKDGHLYGLIQTPAGELVKVQEGDHLGKDYGKILKISPTRIDVMEIVPDGKGGFVERPRILAISDAGLVKAG